MSRLILWDIDGTLVYTVVAGAAMRAAMGRGFGPVPEQERHAYAGKTDQQIILETFAERHHKELEEMNPDQYLAKLLGDAKGLDQRNQDVERFVAKLEKFIASAPPADKQAAVRDQRFVTDRNSPPPGMFGFTSFWQCEWRYDAQGRLSVSVEYVT